MKRIRETGVAVVSGRERIAGVVMPNARSEAYDHLRRALSSAIRLVPFGHQINAGTVEEFGAAVPVYERAARELAEADVEVVHLVGTHVFMHCGYVAERELVSAWQAAAGVPMFTSGMNHIAALRAFRAKRITGVTYFGSVLNELASAYFRDAGFEVAAMEGMDVPFGSAKDVDPVALQEFIRDTVRSHPCDAYYAMGPAWPIASVVTGLERELGIPVVHHLAAQVWELHRRLGVPASVAGLGRLLAENPR